jgi:hypothetical protein
VARGACRLQAMDLPPGGVSEKFSQELDYTIEPPRK